MPKKKRRILICLILILCLPALLATPFFKWLFPFAYRDVVIAYSHDCELPLSLVCGVIWCESRFCPEAKSPAGAYGLMQLTPATFGEIAEELGLPPCSDIFDPAVNIRCGTYYLKTLLKRFPEPSTALAAYNAGIGNVSSWLADPRYSHDGRTLHTIPFPETREYVKRVLFVQKIYENLYPNQGES